MPEGVRLAASPAAVFGTVIRRDGSDPLSKAALRAYHASVAWGVRADEKGLAVFNSQWLVDADWFRLPRTGYEKGYDVVTLKDRTATVSEEEHRSVQRINFSDRVFKSYNFISVKGSLTGLLLRETDGSSGHMPTP
jgi:hypothetical protein